MGALLLIQKRPHGKGNEYKNTLPAKKTTHTHKYVESFFFCIYFVVCRVQWYPQHV